MNKQKSALPEVDALATVLSVLVPLSEKQRAWVVASAAANLDISTLNASPITNVPPVPPGTAPLAIFGTRGTPEHAKKFLRAKNPNTTAQRIACLAYYLTHHQNTPQFKTRDITKMNSTAAGIRLTNPSMAVDNATKQSKYLAPAGRGKKQLTGFGEEVVNVLPDQSAVTALHKAEPARRKRKPRKKAA